MSSIPGLLLISGSDSGGAAGMQADIKTAALSGVYPVCALTAVTAQNSKGIVSMLPIEPDVVVRQIDAILDDLKPRAVKIGMLPSAEHVDAVASTLRKHDLHNIVLDPVLMSTSGHSLNDNKKKTAEKILKELSPISAVVTPNIPEAKYFIELNNMPVEESMESNAENLLSLFGSESIILKGGHNIQDSEVVDLLCINYEGNPIICKSSLPMIETTNLHGSGCVFSTAIASSLAKGRDICNSFMMAEQFVHTAILMAKERSPYSGYGPLYLSPD